MPRCVSYRTDPKYLQLLEESRRSDVRSGALLPGVRLSNIIARALHGRVLVADDLPDAASSLALLCELYGAEVRQASNGIEAVEVAGLFQPHVVLMDISMPGMNGYEAARAIRANEWGKFMVLIALTGWGRPADLDAAREAGFDRHLLKPVHPERLVKLIASLQTRSDQY